VYSDYDLLVVLKDRRDFPEAQSAFPGFARSVTDELRLKGLCSHVDFAPVTRDYFTGMSPSMFSVEVVEHGKIVWGDRNAMQDAAHPDPAKIPVDDALILLFNRTASHLSMADSLRDTDDREFPFAFYHNGKIFLDIVSCILVLEHRYRPTYVGRLNEISQVESAKVSRLPGIVEDASFWTDYKLNPRTGMVLENYSSLALSSDRQDVGIFLWNHLVPKMTEVLRMCIGESCGREEAPLGSSLAACLRKKSLLRRLREYRNFVRRFGSSLQAGRLSGPLSILRGSPLDLAYASLALLLLCVKELSRDSVEIGGTEQLADAESFLPLEVTREEEVLNRWRQTRDAATEVWRLVVKGGSY
jgi:hypothetical protein